MVAAAKGDLVRRNARTVRWRLVTDREVRYSGIQTPLKRGFLAKKQIDGAVRGGGKRINFMRDGLSFVPHGLDCQMERVSDGRMPSLGLAASRWWPKVGRDQSAARVIPPPDVPPDWEKR